LRPAGAGVTSTALIAEPSQTFRSLLETIIETAGWHVVGRSALEEARKDISERAPSVVVTSLKLGSFNGVHLCYLAKLANPLAVCIVYGEADRAEEAQRAGAIYVDQQSIREALPEILASMKRRILDRSGEILPFPIGRLNATES
jgi:DNA-binding NtrC family response regulator